MREVSLLLMAVLAASGCTFGLGEQVSFVTRNLELSGALAEGPFATEEGTITVVPQAVELERGVVIFIDGTDGAQSLTSTLQFDGNLGALCPGSRVELRGDGDRLVASDVSGAPVEMLDQLSRLELTMLATANGVSGVEEVRPTRVELTSAEGTGGFSVMSFTSTGVVDGEERRVEGTFEIARVVEETAVPGWEGDTWEGQPIESWE